MHSLLILFRMDNDRNVKRSLGKALWGYPDLVRKLFEVLGPALVEERERRREKEEAVQQRTTMEHVDNVSEVVAEDNDDTTPVTPQANESPSLDNISECPDVKMTDSQGQLDERSRLTATSASTKAPKPTSGDLILRPNIEEEVATPN